MKELSDYSSKELNFYRIVIMVISIIIFLMCLLLCLAMPLVGLIGCAFSAFLFYTALQYKKISAKIDFPEFDEHGKKALVIREADVYGVGRTYNGIPAQDIISTLKAGDEVLFEVSKSDSVKVLTSDKKQFGYLPEWKNLDDPKVKAEVYSKLMQGATVLGKVKKTYINASGKQGVVIRICRYAK